jgi:prephenate dehydrogenase
MSSQRATIFGTGLLGASVGLALRSQGWVVQGWDPSPDALEEAVSRGAVEYPLAAASADDTELIVLAAPPDAVVETLQTMDTPTLVTDIAGIKVPIVAAAAHLPHYVGGHPMAGGETSGASLASSSLFHGATWVLTSDRVSGDDLERMRDIVSSFGANPVVMTAEDHDAAVARVSHLPHVLAAALMRLADEDPATLGLAGGGFRDLTRIAAADSTWWAEVLAANADQVGASIDELQRALESWKETIRNGGEGLTERLESARRARLGVGEHHTQVRVILMDKPGEIARVGHALETSRVDVRDFQLRHGEHGGGGVLTISVRGDGKEALTMALVDEGFEVKVE